MPQYIDRHPSPVPGDLVRDRITQEDYVIHAIEIAAGAGLVGITLVNIFTRRMREEILEYREIEQQFLTIKANTRKLQPLEALSEIQAQIVQGLQGSGHLFDELAKPENVALRDMLYISGNVTEGTFSKGIVDFARSLVLSVGGKPDSKTLFSIFRTSVSPEDLTDEYLQHVVDRVQSVVNVVGSSLGQGSSLTPTQNSEVVKFFQSGEYGFLREHGLVSPRKFRSAEFPVFEGFKGKQEKNFLENLLGGGEQARRLFASHPLFAQMPTGSRREQQAYLAEEVIKYLGGFQDMTEVGRNMLKRFARQAQWALGEGKKSPFHELILKLTEIKDARAQIVDVSGIQRLRQINDSSYRNMVDTLTHRTFPQFAKTRRRSRNYDRYLPDYSPTTGPVDWGAVQTQLETQEAGEIVSITHEALLSHLIGDRGFRLKGDKTNVTRYLANNDDRTAIYEHLGVDTWNKVGSSIGTRRSLRTLLEQRSENMTLNLASLVQDSAHLHGTLSGQDLAAITESHFTSNGSRSMATRSSVNMFNLQAGSAGIRKAGAKSSVLGDTTLKLHERLSQYLNLQAPEGGTRLWGVEDDEGYFNESTSLQTLFAHIRKHSARYSQTNRAGRRGILFRDSLERETFRGVRQVRATNFQPIAQFAEEGNYRVPGNFVRGLQGTARVHGPRLGNKIHAAHGVKGAAREGLSRYRVAIARLSSNDPAKIEQKLIGTPIPHSTAQGQLELMKRFYGGHSMIMDIETRQLTPGDPTSTYMRQIGWGTGSSVSNIKVLETKSSVERAQAIVEFAEHMSKVEVVASHGSFDPIQLLKMCERLSQDPHIKNTPLAVQIRRASSQIQDTLKNQRWLDLTGMHAMRTGESLSRINQAYLQIKYLTGEARTELHEAHMDISHAYMLAEQGKADILHNVERTTLHTGGDHLIMETDQMGNNYGRVFSVQHVEHLNYVHALKGEGYVAHVQEIGMDGSRGTPYQIVAENPMMLNAQLAKRGVTVAETEISKLRPAFEAMLDDRAGRELRELFNPTRLTAPHDGWTKELATEWGHFGSMQVQLRKTAIALSKGVDPVYGRVGVTLDATGRRVAQYGNISEGTPSVFHSKLNALMAAAESADEHWNQREGIVRAARETVDEWLLSDEGEKFSLGHSAYGLRFGRKVLEDELVNMESHPHYRALLTDKQASSYARVLDSPFVEAMLQYRKGEVTNVGMNWSRQLAHSIPINMATIFEEQTGGRTLQSFGHRLSLRAGGVQSTLQYGGMDAAFDAGRQLEKFAPQLLQKLGKEATLRGQGYDIATPAHDYVNEILRQSSELGHYDASLYAQKVQEFAARHGDDFSDLPAWKDMTSTMGFTDDPISKLVKEINISPQGTHRALREAIKQRQQDILDLGATEHAERTARMGDVILQALDAHSAIGRSAISTHNLAMSDLFDKHGEDMKAFFHVQGHDAELEDLAFNQDAVHKAIALSHEQIQGMGFPHELGDLISEAYDSSKAAGLVGIDARLHESRFLSAAHQHLAQPPNTPPDQIKARIHQATNMSMGQAQGMGDAQARSERAAIHELMTNASILRSMTVPMMAVGGILALMAARQPTDDGFTQGGVESGYNVGQPAAARYSEIPGNSRARTVWDGDPTPFALDITFEGFVKRKEDQEQLQRYVYDTVAGVGAVQVRNTQVEDNRQRSHVSSARTLLRNNL